MLAVVDRAVLETANDRYVIVEYLAEGGMGAIYLGKKLGVDGFEKEVVLKQLLPEYTRDQRFIEMFLSEARLSASLDHANIVRTVDLVHAGDDYFMVMEYVRGADLGTLMRRAKRRRRPFSAQAALFLGHEVLEALHYAHKKTGPDGRRLGLTHRDVSPSNILLSGAGEVKLTDFGIAKASSSHSVHKIKGKVGYMSPEQARGQAVDQRSDLFSLAVVLYEMLSGERVFVGDLMSSAAMIYAQEVEPLSKKRRELPRELDAVFARGMALEPRKRYQTAEEFQEALMNVAQRRRLLMRASELASHLGDVCGADPAGWFRIETAGEAPAPSTGTAVVSQVDVAVGDDDDDDEEIEAPTRVPASRRPPSLSELVPTSTAQHPDTGTHTVTMTSLILGGQATLSDQSAAIPLMDQPELPDEHSQITTRARKLDRSALSPTLPARPATGSSELPTPPSRLPRPVERRQVSDPVLPSWAPWAFIGGLVALFAVLAVVIGWSGGQPDLRRPSPSPLPADRLGEVVLPPSPEAGVGAALGMPSVTTPLPAPKPLTNAPRPRPKRPMPLRPTPYPPM